MVAQEVRALPGRWADSARDVNRLLKESGAEVARGVALARESGAALAGAADGLTGAVAFFSGAPDAAPGETAASLAAFAADAAADGAHDGGAPDNLFAMAEGGDWRSAEGDPFEPLGAGR